MTGARTIGWHSYIVPYETKQQLEAILDVLRLHNDRRLNPDNHPIEFVRFNPHEAFARLEPGEVLQDAELVGFKARKWYYSPTDGPALPCAVVFHNEGDRNATFAFLQWHLMRALPDVYVDAFPAITAYPYNDTIAAELTAVRRAVPDERIAARSMPQTYTGPLAHYVTRTVVGNPAFRVLMCNLYGAERKTNMRDNPDVPPYLAQYEARDSECGGSQVDQARPFPEVAHKVHVCNL